MSRFRIVTTALFVLLVFVCGCTSTQGGKNLWKGTRIFYNRHVNKPAKLEFDDSNPLKPHQITLVEAMSAVDFELQELLRAMDDSDRSPDEAWGRGLLQRFPWLSGVFMVDRDGYMLSGMPEANGPLPDLTRLLAEDDKQRPTDLRAEVFPTLNGAEIYLAKPVYLQSELRVIIVCCFDLRALLARCGKPENFMAFSGEDLLWQGVYTFAETPLSGQDWTSLGLKQVDGVLGNERGDFYWLACFFANIQIIYATPVQGDFSVNPEQMAILRDPVFAGAGD